MNCPSCNKPMKVIIDKGIIEWYVCNVEKGHKRSIRKDYADGR